MFSVNYKLVSLEGVKIEKYRIDFRLRIVFCLQRGKVILIQWS